MEKKARRNTLRPASATLSSWLLLTVTNDSTNLEILKHMVDSWAGRVRARVHVSSLKERTCRGS
jgi:hypothetical protein